MRLPGSLGDLEQERLHAGINFLRSADMFFSCGNLVLNERREKIENSKADRKLKNREEKMIASNFRKEKT